jgi:hypothetical protein
VGRRVRTTNSGGTVYGSVTSATFATNTTIGITADSGNLDAGLSAVYYSLVTPAGTGSSIFSPTMQPTNRTASSAIKNGDQTGFASATKVINWTLQDFSNNAGWSGNTFTAPYTGQYFVWMQAQLTDTAATQPVSLSIVKNGAGYAAVTNPTHPTAGQLTANYIGRVITLAAGDTIEMFVTGTANTTVKGTNGTNISISRIA